MLPPILQRVKAEGYRVFTGLDGEGKQWDYDLNIIAVRTAGTHLTDHFDDMLCCIYKEGGQWVGRYWPITTDPGRYYLETASEDFNAAGAAILAPGQYRGAYKIGPHGPTKYNALVQAGNEVTVYRDADRDLEYDHVNPETGMFGINIHASSMDPYRKNVIASKVGRWSAGCQVFKNTKHFRAFMYLCQQQIGYTGYTTFTYTLLEDE
tara:strand:+ start:266 stop:889 length:624 start_codon:yes stop_codon:yes gene_type:complete